MKLFHYRYYLRDVVRPNYEMSQETTTTTTKEVQLIQEREEYEKKKITLDL